MPMALPSLEEGSEVQSLMKTVAVAVAVAVAVGQPIAMGVISLPSLKYAILPLRSLA